MRSSNKREKKVEEPTGRLTALMPSHKPRSKERQSMKKGRELWSLSLNNKE